VLAVLPRGDRFVARGFRDAIGIFTLAGRQIGDWIPAKSALYWSLFGVDGDGARLAFAASDNEVAVPEVATGKLLRRCTCEAGKVMHVLLSPDGGTVLAIGENKIIAYATQTGAPRWTRPLVSALPAFSPDSREVAILAAQSGPSVTVQLLDTRTGATRRTLEATGDNPAKASLQFNRAGDRLACLGGDELILWDPRTGVKERALHFPGEEVILLSPGGDAVATKRDGRIRLWDTVAGRLLRSLNGAGTAMLALAF